ncbi:hypothetical protein QC764_0074860 [Podospora pseudoanserina]|uniref:Major facilitator superfamily (MFS) profile domain-containing protein n=2 Tax=Podospora TaxID=5144 RepID=A0ABR0I468_9PEZI|nr:hypothetical protein QC764_0074860 [Podospora pseudoanserina]
MKFNILATPDIWIRVRLDRPENMAASRGRNKTHPQTSSQCLIQSVGAISGLPSSSELWLFSPQKPSPRQGPTPDMHRGKWRGSTAWDEATGHEDSKKTSQNMGCCGGIHRGSRGRVGVEGSSKLMRAKVYYPLPQEPSPPSVPLSHIPVSVDTEAETQTFPLPRVRNYLKYLSPASYLVSVLPYLPSRSHCLALSPTTTTDPKTPTLTLLHLPSQPQHNRLNSVNMPGGAAPPVGADTLRVEAPVTMKAYLMCVFAAFGGIFFGYDSGYIAGVMGMDFFIKTIEGPGALVLPAWKKSLITSILSAGTFFGSLAAGDLADWIGRKFTVILGCMVFIVGVVLQTASASLGLIVAGRLVAGFGVGFVSAIIILYMSEIAPRKVRGAIVSGYQFCICIGLLLASCVNYGTQDRDDSASYRVPIGLQMAWALILAGGLALLPESPRFFVRKGQLDKARVTLARLRDQPLDSEYIRDELAEIIANHEYETSIAPVGGYWSAWMVCFQGSIFNSSSNLRRTVLGTSLQMMQQWTGCNFVFYFGTTFFQQLGTISNPFLISLITTLVNVCSTPISFWSMERVGRRPLLIWGALGMVICQYIVAIIGTVKPDDDNCVKAMIAFICIYIFFFATTWGPGAWVVIGEVFPLPMRAKGVALSTASNWLWNCIIAVITPYMVDSDKGNLGAKVFWIWGSLCCCCFLYAFLLVPETKGLTLEQVDQMLNETTPRTSARWVPHSTYAGGEKAEKSVQHHEEKVTPSGSDGESQV